MKKIYEDFLDFNQIKGYDSILVLDEELNRELVIKYENDQLSKVLYINSRIDSISTRRFYGYDSLGRLENVEQVGCLGFLDLIEKVKIHCIERYVVYERKFLYDKEGALVRDSTDYFFRGSKTISENRHYESDATMTYVDTLDQHSSRFQFEYDRKGRLTFKRELNEKNEIFYEYQITYQKKSANVKYSMYRDRLDDVPIEKRCFEFELILNSNGTPKTFINGEKSSTFSYFPKKRRKK